MTASAVQKTTPKGVTLTKTMELEFDKEIDSLLRKTGEGGRGVLVGDKPGEKPKVHLDADQLSAFAENAMPEKTRALYMSHLADCDRCRRILSGLIMLNAEAEPAGERIVAPAISPGAVEPWYRRLLLPNLAYVTGGLVLVFGGLIAISVLQFSDREAATVSQSVEAPAASGPMFEDGQAITEQMANSNSNAASTVANTAVQVQSANSAANASATAANVASNSMADGTDSDRLRKETAPKDAPGYTLDGIDAAKPTAGAPPAPPPAPMAAPKREDTEVTTDMAAESKDDSKARSVPKKKAAENEVSESVLSSRKVQDLPINSRQAQEVPRTQAGGVAKSTPGPSRDAQQNRANNTFDLYEEKRISGKGFQRRNNVWYDNSYRGQATTNVRRGTDEYRKLDSGLRSIAETLGGVVVVMWSGKAYRIQ